MMKRCYSCDQIKAPEAFNKNKRYKNGLDDRCKDCVKQYGKQYRAACKKKAEQANQTEQRKRCTTCNLFLPLASFRISRSRKGGHQNSCMSCTRKYDKQRRSRNIQADTNWKLKYRFGITLAQYTALYEAQTGLCAICGQPEIRKVRGQTCRLAVDHDHKTGQIRKLLCHSCNAALGLFKDNPDIMEKAAQYVRHGGSYVSTLYDSGGLCSGLVAG